MSNFRSGEGSPFDESKKNKAKMTSDSIRIAGNDMLNDTVSSKLQFQNTFGASRQINTGLDKLTKSYITGSHFKPGYGGFSGRSENMRAFQPGRSTEPNNLSPEKI